jgi:hypothetical protein
MPIFVVAWAMPPPPAPAGVSCRERIERLLPLDGAHEQPHLGLLLGEDVLDARAHLRLLGIGPTGPLRHRLA